MTNQQPLHGYYAPQDEISLYDIAIIFCKRKKLWLSSLLIFLVASIALVVHIPTATTFQKIIYLPDTYQVNDSTKKISDKVFTREELGLPEDSFVFCCFNKIF